MKSQLQNGRHTRPCGRKDGGGLLLRDWNECMQDAWVKLGSSAAEQARNRLGVGKALPVAAIRDHRIESIDDTDDPRNHWNVAALESSRIARSIHALVMVQRIETRFFETREQPQD